LYQGIGATVDLNVPELNLELLQPIEEPSSLVNLVELFKSFNFSLMEVYVESNPFPFIGTGKY